ncbi:MAG TPA: family 15 carbohydrate-binding domain-containing protein [Cellvibrio sp.]|nr:family 15 carbohydrate-binding domain-containing protein [Cellvibrio sp.]
MLKSLSVILGASLLLTACGGGGGGGGGNNKPSSAAISSSANSTAVVSSVSSVALSSAVKSSTPASVVSSSSLSSVSGPAVIDLPLASWYAEKEAGFSAGVVAVTTQWQGAGYYLNQPIPELEFATIEVTVAVDNAFKASGSGLSLWAVVDASPWPGKTDCAAVESSALVEGVDTKVTCVLDSGGAFAQTAAPVKLGIQATTTPAGTFTIKSARILLTKASDFSSSSSSAVSSSAAAVSSESSVSSSVVSSAESSSSSSVVSSAASSSSSSVASSAASSQARIEMAWDWYTEGASAVVWENSNPKVSPTATWAGAGWYYGLPVVSLENATVNFVVNVDTAFKNSGASLQLWVSLDGGSDSANCAWLPNGNLVAGQDVTYSCTLIYSWLNQTAKPVKFGLVATDVTPAGSFLIKDRYIALP